MIYYILGYLLVRKDVLYMKNYLVIHLTLKLK